MRITEYLKADTIKVFLQGTNKEEVVCEMVEFLLANGYQFDREEVVTALFATEKISTTGIGGSIAIPHAKIDSISNLIAALGLAKEPVGFSAIDKKPVKLVFLILTPREKLGLHIRFLARVSRLLHNTDLKKQLFLCNNASEVFETFRCYEEKHFS